MVVDELVVDVVELDEDEVLDVEVDVVDVDVLVVDDDVVDDVDDVVDVVVGLGRSGELHPAVGAAASHITTVNRPIDGQATRTARL